MFARLAAVVVIIMASIGCSGSAASAAKPVPKNVQGRSEVPAVEFTEVVEGNNRFALELYHQLRANGQGNLFFSPYSISTALAMTYAGADGETKQEMADALHFTLPSAELHDAFAGVIDATNPGDGPRDYSLSVANRLWGEREYGFRPEFLDVTRRFYGAELVPVSFRQQAEQARLAINDWVAEETNGKIRDLIAPGILDATTRLVLTNAIYFKGNWTHPFSKDHTQTVPFHVSANKEVEAPLMHQTEQFGYAESPELQTLELPYGSTGDLSMIALLPRKKDGLKQLEDQLTPATLKQWTARLGVRKVEVFLPRFKLTEQFQLNEPLQALGMRQAFDSAAANFSGMSPSNELYLTAVIHKAFVDVNEEGTEAAAATGVVVGIKSAVPAPVPVFRADHPFLFLIRDNRTGSLLFVGRVVQPE